MQLLVILLDAVWHCNAHKYFPFCMCYFINSSFCLGLIEQIFVSGHCLLGDVWGRFSQVTCWDQMHLIKHCLKILFSPLKTFSLLNFWHVYMMFFIICWQFVFSFQFFPSGLWKTFPLLNFWHVSVMFFVICWWFVISFQFILIFVMLLFPTQENIWFSFSIPLTCEY